MKVTITLPDDIYRKLESDRGRMPRSTYIQCLVVGESVAVVPVTPIREVEVPRAPQKPKKSPKKTSGESKVVDSGRKGLGSQKMDGGFVTYFKDAKL